MAVLWGPLLPSSPYLTRSLLPPGGVGEGEAYRSPNSSPGRQGPWRLGGVDEVFRADDEPRRDTHDVSITRTPMLLYTHTRPRPITERERSGGAHTRPIAWGEVRGGTHVTNERAGSETQVRHGVPTNTQY